MIFLNLLIKSIIFFLHFKSLWYSVFVGKQWNKEIDFIVKKWNDKKYIQVCYLLENESTIEREFWNLLAISDNYKKIVLSLDEFMWADYKGIKHYNIIEYITKP